MEAKEELRKWDKRVRKRLDALDKNFAGIADPGRKCAKRLDRSKVDLGCRVLHRTLEADARLSPVTGLLPITSGPAAGQAAEKHLADHQAALGTLRF